jgi:hypothetical protein
MRQGAPAVGTSSVCRTPYSVSYIQRPASCWRQRGSKRGPPRAKQAPANIETLHQRGTWSRLPAFLGRFHLGDFDKSWSIPFNGSHRHRLRRNILRTVGQPQATVAGFADGSFFFSRSLSIWSFSPLTGSRCGRTPVSFMSSLSFCSFVRGFSCSDMLTQSRQYSPDRHTHSLEGLRTWTCFADRSYGLLRTRVCRFAVDVLRICICCAEFP